MRELVLVLPDLFLPPTAARPAADAASTAWRFAAPRALRGGWRGLLARGVGREDLAWVEVASLIDAGLRGVADAPSAAADEHRVAAAAPAAAEVWVATPLHLVAGLKSVHFPAHGLLQLTRDEAAELAREFGEIFGGDGLELIPAGTAGFVLRGLATGGAATQEPARLVGGTLEEAFPDGPGGAALRALGSELELWLHALPLNARRLARGAAPISTLWLWGGGAVPRDALAGGLATTAARWQCLLGEDAWLQALGCLAGVATAPLPLDWDAADLAEACCAVVPLADRDPQALERELILPLVRRMNDGRLNTLIIAANDRWISLRAADRWKIWRPKRTVLEAILESPA